MSNGRRHGGAYPLWTAEDDQRLMAMCQGKNFSNAAWTMVAEEFSGRSMQAVRQRYFTLRERAAGIFRSRDRKSRPIRQGLQLPKVGQALPPAADHLTLTSALLGDPLPGRSALDKMRAGIVDPPVLDHREAYFASRPRITLATEPMR